jgi:hypothetical protein
LKTDPRKIRPIRQILVRAMVEKEDQEKIKEQAIATNLEKKGTKKIIFPTPKMDVKITEQQAFLLTT